MCELEADELADQLAGLSVNLPASAVDLLTAETRSLVRGIKLNYSAQETQVYLLPFLMEGVVFIFKVV